MDKISKVNKKLNQPIVKYGWGFYHNRVQALANKITNSGKTYRNIFGIPRGGLITAVILSHILNLPLATEIKAKTLIVDDICDSGSTLLAVKNDFPDNDTAVINLRYNSRFNPDYYVITIEDNTWIKYPYEI